MIGMIFGAHVIVYSKDAEADRAFLRDVLGFSSVDAGHGWLIFALPPGEVAVHPDEKGNRHELYFMCDDLKAEIAALGKKGDANYGTGCDVGGNKDSCATGSQGLALHSDAYSDANLSTVFLGAGAAAVIGGAVLFLTAPSSSAPAASVGFDGRVLRLTGSF